MNAQRQLASIVYELGGHSVRSAHSKSGRTYYEVYRQEATSSVRCATIDLGDGSFDRAKAECVRREAQRQPTVSPTAEQLAEIVAWRAKLPYRIAFGAYNPSTHEFFASAVTSMRIPNKLAREGWAVWKA